MSVVHFGAGGGPPAAGRPEHRHWFARKKKPAAAPPPPAMGARVDGAPDDEIESVQQFLDAIGQYAIVDAPGRTVLLAEVRGAVLAYVSVKSDENAGSGASAAVRMMRRLAADDMESELAGIKIRPARANGGDPGKEAEVALFERLKTAENKAAGAALAGAPAFLALKNFGLPGQKKTAKEMREAAQEERANIELVATLGASRDLFVAARTFEWAKNAAHLMTLMQVTRALSLEQSVDQAGTLAAFRLAARALRTFAKETADRGDPRHYTDAKFENIGVELGEGGAPVAVRMLDFGSISTPTAASRTYTLFNMSEIPVEPLPLREPLACWNLVASFIDFVADEQSLRAKIASDFEAGHPFVDEEHPMDLVDAIVSLEPDCRKWSPEELAYIPEAMLNDDALARWRTAAKEGPPRVKPEDLKDVEGRGARRTVHLETGVESEVHFDGEHLCAPRYSEKLYALIAEYVATSADVPPPYKRVFAALNFTKDGLKDGALAWQRANMNYAEVDAAFTAAYLELRHEAEAAGQPAAGPGAGALVATGDAAGPSSLRRRRTSLRRAVPDANGRELNMDDWWARVIQESPAAALAIGKLLDYDGEV